MKIRALLMSALLMAPAAGMAQPYVSAQLGYASSEWPLGAPFNGRIDDTAFALGADLGIGFTDHWALEVGALRYGGLDGSGVPCVEGASCPPVVQEVNGNDLTIYKVSIIPRYTFGAVHVFGEAGYYRAKIDTEVNLPDSDFRDNGLLLGIGVRWYFSDPWSMSLKAERLDDNLYQVLFGVGWGLRLGDN
jgi:hypothetical protein